MPGVANHQRERRCRTMAAWSKEQEDQVLARLYELACESCGEPRYLPEADDDILREHIAEAVISLDIPEQHTTVTPVVVEGVFEAASDALTWLERGKMCAHCDHVWSTYD